MSNNNIKRKISYEDDFYNKEIDTLLYGIMACLATYNPKEKRLYLTKAAFEKNKDLICNITFIDQKKQKARTLANHINTLIQHNLLAEIQISDLKGRSFGAYIFPQNFDGNYYLISRDMLRYLVNTRNSKCIQTYVYLAKNMKMVQDNELELFSFTAADIARKIGYSTGSKAAMKLIQDCLESLKREGVIDYVEYYEYIYNEESERTIYIPRKRLLRVVTNIADLEKMQDIKKKPPVDRCEEYYLDGFKF